MAIPIDPLWYWAEDGLLMCGDFIAPSWILDDDGLLPDGTRPAPFIRPGEHATKIATTMTSFFADAYESPRKDRRR